MIDFEDVHSNGQNAVPFLAWFLVGSGRQEGYSLLTTKEGSSKAGCRRSPEAVLFCSFLFWIWTNWLHLRPNDSAIY